MRLSKQDKLTKELGQEAKGFLESNLFQVLQQHLSDQLSKEYPRPMGDQWQDQYRYARAYEQVAADLVNFLIGLKNQLTVINEKQKTPETSIDEA
jgi:hypothetical protein